MRRLVPILLLALGSIGFYWRIALTDQYIWFDHSDMAYLELPRLQYEARAIHAGRLPLWNTNLFFGQPLVGGIQPGPLYPLNLLFCLLPLDQGFVSFRLLNWYWILIHFQAALFAYLFLKDRGLGAGPALVGGFVFSYAGFMGSVPWFDVANGTVWIPLVLLFVWRAGERPRTFAASTLGGLALGVAWLSGHHELPLLTSLAAVATFAWFLWTGRGRRWRLAGGLGVFLLTAALVSAVQILPMLEFGRLSVRWVGTPEPVGWKDVVPYTIHAIYSMTARDLLGTFVLGGPQAERGFYLGLVVAALAAMGLMTGWRQRAVRWAGALAVGALVWALGQATFAHGLLYAMLPLADKARVALRASALVHCGVAILAAFGVQALLEERVRRTLGRVAVALAVVGGVILGGTLYRLAATNQLSDEGVLRAGFVALAAAAVLAACRARRIRAATAAVALACLMLAELSPMAAFPSRFEKDGWKFASALHRNDDAGAYLRGAPGDVRVSTNETELPENFGEWQGVSASGGYTAGVTSNMRRQEWHLPVWQNIGAVTHYLGQAPSRPDQVDLFAGQSGVHIWSNPGALPRAWLAHAAETVASAEALNERVRQPGFDPRRQALLLGPAPRLETCAVDEEYAFITGRGANHVTLDVRAACTALLVLAETNYPGWEVFLGGRPAPIIEVYGGLRGVVVGPHAPTAVSFQFRPAAVRWGFRLTLAGLALVLLCCALERRRAAA